MIKQSTTVTIRTVRRRSIRVMPGVLLATCPICNREVEMLTRRQAAEILQVHDATIDGLIAARKLHAILTVSGNFCICKPSLFAE